MPSLIDKWSTYNLHIMLPVPDSIAIALWRINALRLSPIMRSLGPYIVPCPSFRAAQRADQVERALPTGRAMRFRCGRQLR